jgi:hypothetical protein
MWEVKYIIYSNLWSRCTISSSILKFKKEFWMGQGVAWHAHKFMKKQDMCHGWHCPPSHLKHGMEICSCWNMANILHTMHTIFRLLCTLNFLLALKIFMPYHTNLWVHEIMLWNVNYAMPLHLVITFLTFQIFPPQSNLQIRKTSIQYESSKAWKNPSSVWKWWPQMLESDSFCCLFGSVKAMYFEQFKHTRPMLLLFACL